MPSVGHWWRDLRPDLERIGVLYEGPQGIVSKGKTAYRPRREGWRSTLPGNEAVGLGHVAPSILYSPYQIDNLTKYYVVLLSYCRSSKDYAAKRKKKLPRESREAKLATVLLEVSSKSGAPMSARDKLRLRKAIGKFARAALKD